MMRLDRRSGTVLAISLAWATIVAGIFYRLAGSAGSRARAESRKEVVVAARPLPVGVMLDRECLKLRVLPAENLPAGTYARLEDVVGRPVVSPIQEGEPVVEARIAAKGSGAGLAPLIPPGMRAISVRVNDVVGVAGFVLPGMRVDVLVTARPSGQSDTFTRTVLQNIQVLSAGQTTQTDGKSQSILAQVVTLLVDPQEAEAVTLANSEGRIQLVLRNSADAQVSATHGRRLREIFGAAPEPPAPREDEAQLARSPRPRQRTASAPAPPPESAAPPAAVPPEEQRMIVYRGTVRTVAVFPAERAQ
jgi:pilus assembly protein CpaB